MRTTVLGFNQHEAIELGLDVTDLILMDYIQRANGAPDMKHVTVDSVAYVWLSHKKIHEDLPILDMSEGTLKNRLLNLKKKGMIMSTSVKVHNGTMTYYSLTIDATSLTNDVPRQENDVARHSEMTWARHSEMTWARHSEMTSNNTLDNHNKLDNNSISINTNTTSTRESDNSPADVKKFVDDYNTICKSLPKCRSVTNERRQKIKHILKSFKYEDILQVFNSLENSDFCKGINDRGWKASFDFVIKESKFVAVLEGRYDNNKGRPRRDIFSEYGKVHTGGERGEIVDEEF